MATEPHKGTAEHEEWLRSRRKPTPASRARALQLLDEGGKNAPVPGDELPEGYHSTPGLPIQDTL